MNTNFYQNYNNELKRIREEIQKEQQNKAFFVSRISSELNPQTPNHKSSVRNEIEHIFKTITDLTKHYEYCDDFFLIEPKKCPKRKSQRKSTIHKLLKKYAVLTHPRIFELSANGFRELDYLLFLEAEHLIHLLKK